MRDARPSSLVDDSAGQFRQWGATKRLLMSMAALFLLAEATDDKQLTVAEVAGRTQNSSSMMAVARQTGVLPSATTRYGLVLCTVRYLVPTVRSAGKGRARGLVTKPAKHGQLHPIVPIVSLIFSSFHSLPSPTLVCFFLATILTIMSSSYCANMPLRTSGKSLQHALPVWSTHPRL